MARNHTRRQHWVPQMYLRNWAVSGRLCVADKLTGRVLTNQNTLNFAQGHDFYGFVDLNPKELRCLVEWTHMTFPRGIALIEKMLSVMVLNVLRFRVENQDWSDGFKESFDAVKPQLLLSDAQDKMYQLFYSFASNHIKLPQKEKDELGKLTENGFEDFHCAIENGARLVLEIVKHRDLSFFFADSQKTMYLLIYLYDQFFRSRKYLKLIEENSSEMRRRIGATNRLVRNFRYFLPVLYYFSSIHLKDARKMAAVRNESGAEFVTSDAPVVLSGGLHEDLPALMYFPLSPRAAIFYGVKKNVNRVISDVGREIYSKKFVSDMNQCVVTECERFIFGSSRQALESLRF